MKNYWKNFQPLVPHLLLLNGSGAIYQTAASMSELIPLILTLYLLPKVVLKVSPLLFCLNDLPSTMSACQIESYVDNSKLFLSFQLSDIDQSFLRLKQDLLRTAQWLYQNHLLINPDKTKLLLIGTRQMLSRLSEDLSMSHLGEKLKPSKSAKDLRVLFDPHLTYDHHITSIV